MVCKHFSQFKEICGKGMPVERIYMELICGRSPEKCPLVAARMDFKCVIAN